MIENDVTIINSNSIHVVLAIGDGHIDSTRKFLLFIMAILARPDGTGICESIPALAKMTNLSYNTVLKSLRSLTESGFIVKTKISDSVTPTEYSLNIPVIESYHYDNKTPKKRVLAFVRRRKNNVFNLR